MKLKEDEYILINEGFISTDDNWVAYCLVRYVTIPLENFDNINLIPKSKEIEGNLVYVNMSNLNYQIFIKGNWYAAKLLTKEKFKKKKRDSKLESLFGMY